MCVHLIVKADSEEIFLAILYLFIFYNFVIAHILNLKGILSRISAYTNHNHTEIFHTFPFLYSHSHNECCTKSQGTWDTGEDQNGCGDLP